MAGIEEGPMNEVELQELEVVMERHKELGDDNHGYGVFSYLKGYHFKVRSSHTFTAAEGKLTELTVNAYEKGNLTTAVR